jgi:uncharacterized membrane protein YqjE
LAVSTEKPPHDHRPGPGSDSTSAIAQSIQEVSERAQNLVREEIELAKAEVQAKAQKLAMGAGVAAAAGTFAAVGLLFILIALAFLLTYLLFPNDQLFWGFFIVAAVLLIVAAIAGLVAYRAFKAGTPPQPTMAIEEAKRIRETVTSDRPDRTV